MKHKLINYFHNHNYTPKTFDAILHDLEIVNQKQEAREILNDLLANYEIIKGKKEKYYLPRDVGIHEGIITIKKAEYGFIIAEGFEYDFYVSKSNLFGAYDRDKVLFQIMSNTHSSYNNYEARVLVVRERGLKYVIGELKKYKNEYYLDSKSPITNKVIISNPMDYTIGDIVRAEIFDYNVPLAARIVERVGFKNDINIDVLTIAAEFNFSSTFKAKTLQDLEQLPFDISNEIKTRKGPSIDLIITMDGADAKDLDDAIGIKRLDNGNYLLGVYIADVSFYVQEDSALDEEAYERGTSCYLTNRVIPMLPPLISNNLCSLNPNVEKLVVACEMEINLDGEVVNNNIFPSVIKSDYRMTYEAVNEILKNNNDYKLKYNEITSNIYLMDELKAILYRMRMQRGALTFDINEGKIIVNEVGKPLDVVLLHRGEGEKIIEEFMLIANETIASTVFYLGLPFIYRVHDNPDGIKLEHFRQLVNNLGYRSFKRRVNAKQLQEFLDNLKPDDFYLKVLLLRSMAKAKYSEKNIGHFGLSSRCYTHFTAPIRRYPDLLVHRLLRKYLFNQDIKAEEITQLHQKINYIADYSSKRERDAMECEYRVEDMKKAEYMSNYIGEQFPGIVSSVNRFGIFIVLPNTIEGFVHINTLRGHYEYEGNMMRLIGPGGNFSLGTKVKVEVVKADKESREIDFKIVYNNSKVKGYGKRRRQKQKGYS